jgi:uncharacterized repeat protein (TIGR03803 family)
MTQNFGTRRYRTMNSSRKVTLRISTMCFAIVAGALLILTLAGVPRAVRAQNPAAEKVIFNFTPAAGYSPIGITNGTAGNFYVATQLGGNNQSCADGCGNILRISPSGKATELYAFTPGPDNGAPTPIGALIRDANGVLYGVTGRGGRFGWGSVFKVSLSGAEKTLYNFDTAAGDGYQPESGVTIDSEGNLYGTTYFGGGAGCEGQGCGIVYKVTPSGNETTLYTFTGGTDGGQPYNSPILLDSTGNLYGTTGRGGDLTCSQDPGIGCGTVWKLDTSDNFSVLYTFTGGTDGASPAAGLVMDASSNLYGTASGGGDLSCYAPYGCGVVFEVDSSGNFSVLYTFTGGSGDGEGPEGTLLRDSSGDLYGATVEGGDQSCGLSNGCGVVFKLDSSGNETILHIFAGGTTDGEYPENALVTDGKGNLYGTTYNGGTANDGVIFEVRE